MLVFFLIPGGRGGGKLPTQNCFSFCTIMYYFFIQGSEQGSTSQEQALSAQHAAVINLAGVGSFMQSQAAGWYLYTFIC